MPAAKPAIRVHRGGALHLPGLGVGGGAASAAATPAIVLLLLLLQERVSCHLSLLPSAHHQEMPVPVLQLLEETRCPASVPLEGVLLQAQGSDRVVAKTPPRLLQPEARCVPMAQGEGLQGFPVCQQELPGKTTWWWIQSSSADQEHPQCYEG